MDCRAASLALLDITVKLEHTHQLDVVQGRLMNTQRGEHLLTANRVLQDKPVLNMAWQNQTIHVLLDIIVLGETIYQTNQSTPVQLVRLLTSRT